MDLIDENRICDDDAQNGVNLEESRQKGMQSALHAIKLNSKLKRYTAGLHQSTQKNPSWVQMCHRAFKSMSISSR